MKTFAVFIFFFVSGFCLASEAGNNYMDNFLSTAFPSEVSFLHIDHAVAPDFEIEFEEHVKVFGKVRGKADFKNGSVEGIDQARRLSDCVTKTEPRTGLRAINCTVQFDKLKVRYDGKMKYGRMPKLGITGKAKVSDTHFFVEIVQESPRQPILRNFTCTQKGTMKVKFTGLGPLNRFMNVLEEGYTRHVKAILFDGMNQKLQYAINRALSKDVLTF